MDVGISVLLVLNMLKDCLTDHHENWYVHVDLHEEGS